MYNASEEAKDLLGQVTVQAFMPDKMPDSGNLDNILQFIESNFDRVGIEVFTPADEEYYSDIKHWAISSSEPSEFTVQPRDARDVAFILKYLGAKCLPFGVKTGGHTANPGFSSSPGVLICMQRLDQVVYDPTTKTAVIGAGQTWNNVYKELNENHNVNVLGGRVSNIGVAGFLLGGGYSWQANQYGLAIDTVVAFELVKPDGKIVNVTAASDPDLFFAVRGGGNNFGIVTSFTMKTFPQGPIWGGSLRLSASPRNSNKLQKIKDLFFAVQTFIDQVKDPKAAVLASLGTSVSILGKRKTMLNLMVFYDGPSPPANTFDMFQKIAPTDTTKSWIERDFLDLIENSFPYELSARFRGAFHTVSLAEYTQELLQTIWDRNEYWGSHHVPGMKDRFLHTYSVEPFLPDILSHSDIPSAYPPSRSIAFSPFPVYASWARVESDTAMQDFVKETTEEIRGAASSLGIEIGASYPNYAISGTPLEEMYGDNVEQLKAIKESVDPTDVMGLAGGFKF